VRADKIAKALDKLLLPLGFVRRSRHWNRICSPYVDVIFLDVSRHGTGATLEAGVVYQHAHDLIWSHLPKPDFFDIANGTVRGRTGDLNGTGRNDWWTTDSPADIEAILASTTTLVVPFLERMHSLPAMRDWMTSPAARRWGIYTDMYLSIVYKELGDTTSACETLRQRSKQPMGDWEGIVLRLLASFGCIPDDSETRQSKVRPSQS
jgi:hypothetical protein